VPDGRWQRSLNAYDRMAPCGSESSGRSWRK
jgi:hypothetical protein